ncbi:helix-turn-helix transcriptional regulator [Micromonospora sp. WMMD1082]|uniref:helix-turn-helix domain-containing protein n=1 Tax=Micromonospora sp. WMMD1082 TaxID=3016104 RepID=UPI00241599FA|nr:helix-turn-helix transcriptional regulator [Micromonospora sp. WMMD1082]MDG4792446.1 helix-turn-helix transcriptional regulator [Micromonospora sp. WMMD1082]
MVLLRRVIGDALRARRQGQHRTLREVSSAANVSLGYLSEIERGQKEPSSELLAAICDALGARLSELLREVSDTVALAEQMPGVLVPVQDESAESTPVGAAAVHKATGRGVRQVTSDGSVAVSVRQDSPLKATLRSARVRPAADRTDRDVVCAA